MRIKKFRVEKELDNGWSRWVQPVERGYLMSCCDCGLVHRMNFRIHKGHVQFKAQRAVSYTRQERKKKGAVGFAPTSPQSGDCPQ